MAKKQQPEGKKYNYMDTYGDLVTLLLCFFVLLFSMSTIQEEKYDSFAGALNNQFGPVAGQYPAGTPTPPTTNSGAGEKPPTGETIDPDQTMPQDFSQVSEAISQFIEENNLQGEVTVQVGASGATFIRLSSNLLFGGDSAVLRSEVMEFLDFLGECFLAVDDQILQIRFMGHTASIAGSGTDDWILSSERSGRVASYFERTVGFSPFKLETVGHGRHYPIADNATAAGIALNRRVDIVVISNNTDTLAAALVEAQRVYFPDDDTQYFQGNPEDLPTYPASWIPPS